MRGERDERVRPAEPVVPRGRVVQSDSFIRSNIQSDSFIRSNIQSDSFIRSLDLTLHLRLRLEVKYVRFTGGERLLKIADELRRGIVVV